jgi:apolipoprotein N-acyltransferase
MKRGLLALAGGIVSALAFPRFGPGWLILPGIALFLLGVRRPASRKIGLLCGTVYGLSFFGCLIWWLGRLGLVAVIPLVIAQAAYLALYGWHLSGERGAVSARWYTQAVGGWAVMEMIRYRFPVGGFEWGAAGYALSDQAWARSAAPWIGTTGVTVVAVAAVAAVVLLVIGERKWWVWVALGASVATVVGGTLVTPGGPMPDRGYPVAIVQGSTPCPFEHCSPDERLGTVRQHLALTRDIIPGSVSLVVWSEGSAGDFNADPVQNPEIADAIGAEARRIGAYILVGTDRPLDEATWVNVNVLFDPSGQIVGEYRKQHPVPFGEYIPLRPLFQWIPALDQVPRDMVPGEGPVVFDLGQGVRLGSVISFEGGFSRYLRQEVAAGANLLVVATNEGSYGTTPGSDQFIGMTRMRASELGLDLIHAAVTGRSVVIGSDGGFLSEVSNLGEQQIIYGVVGPMTPSPYAHTGDLLMIVVAITGLAAWIWPRRRW